MKSKIIKSAVVFTLLSIGFCANAELIKTKVDGLNSMLDTNTGLEWLELGYGNATLQGMLNKMVEGGMLEGWSFVNRSFII